MSPWSIEAGRGPACSYLPPSYDGLSPVPLVIVLHGGLANAWSMEEVTDMSDKADKEGFIAAYPNGTGLLKDRFFTWNVGFGFGYAWKNDVDDVGFTRELIQELEKEFEIDKKRVYVTGLSNGAMFSYLLGAELSDVIAAIAPVAGTIGGRANKNAPLIVIPRS